MPSITVYLSAIAIILGILIFFLFIRNGYIQIIFPESRYIDFANLGANSVVFWEQSYNTTPTIPVYTNTLYYSNLVGSLSKLIIDKQNNVIIHEVNASVNDNISVLSVAAINISKLTPLHTVKFSSTFSLDFNRSYYEKQNTQSFPFILNYQFGLLNRNKDIVFSDRDILCFNSTTQQYNVRYQYFDFKTTESSNIAYDTGCTIPLDDSKSFVLHCLYPHKCTETNVLNYVKNITTVSYYDELGSLFYNVSFALRNSDFSSDINTVEYFFVANENFCKDFACDTFRAYLYKFSLIAN